jgi:ATP-dependent helicase YprA (DUF1998 family)
MHRGKKYQVLSLTQPPSVNGVGSYNTKTSNLLVYAKSTKLAYLTRALQTQIITIVKRFESVEVASQQLMNSLEEETPEDDQALNKGESFHEVSSSSSSNAVSKKDDEEISFDLDGPIAGNGVVTVKRTVWGYAKLSPINRNEISRMELTLPSIEFDTNAFWVCAEASVLKGICPNYDLGVHALSHAILAVAPMFIACSASDIDCDHSFKDCTRMLIFDSRAGGGTHVSNKVWRNLDRILPAAISILEYCTTCCSSSSAENDAYDSGCPACIQGVACVNFQDGLSRRAGLVIAKRMWIRLKNSSLFVACGKDGNETTPQLPSTEDNVSNCLNSKTCSEYSSVNNNYDTTPRKKTRARALETAKNLDNARKRQIVIGRPSWPLDSNNNE